MTMIRLEYEQFLELVKARRSIRNFKPAPIPPDYVEKILEVARWAPSGANSQPWEFIVVEDKKLRDKFINLITQNRTPRRSGFKDAPVFIVVCGDVRKKIFYPGTRFEFENGKIAILENQFMNTDSIFYSSLANAFLYIQLIVKILGLGSQWITGTTQANIQLEIKRLLRIPEYMVIYDTIALGYPASAPNPKTVRTLDEITHYDQYDNLKSETDDEIITSSRRFEIPTMVRERLLEIVEKFRQKEATNPDNAMTAEELDLPPMFKRMIIRRLGHLGIFGEMNGKYYLSEERFKEIQKIIKFKINSPHTPT